jgi:(S)-mandelate dehydrogenase
MAALTADEERLAARLAGLRRRFPTVAELERRARRRIPRFAYDFIQGGTGQESGLTRNRAAFDAMEVVPRYGVDVSSVDTEVELFGRRYAAPIGISPIGFDGMMWPGATEFFARAAQNAKIPYLVGTLACADIEQVAAWAPDVTWFQLYPLPADNHRISFALADRAEAAGAHVLVATLDIPMRAKRVRDMRNGLGMPYRTTIPIAAQAIMAPSWLRALQRRGMPTFANMNRYAGLSPSRADVAAFVGRNVSGGFTWDSMARLRDRWPRALMVKGILHPEDAAHAVALGLDGVVVSNHGGRQFDAAPATIDVLPAIAAAVGERATVMIDSGITSGLDVMRGLACGAAGCFAGRAFMLGLAALGNDGAHHMANLFTEELRIAMGQTGICRLADIRSAALRHPGAWSPEDFGQSVSVQPGGVGLRETGLGATRLG